MGQIVIDIPNKANRRYNIERAEDARALLKALDDLLKDQKGVSNLSRQQIQDLKDGISAERALDEMRRTGEVYSVDDLREEFGLS
jgi:ubiquitin C-terminal hydrolase